MNSRQAAKAAARKIEEMTVTMAFNRADIRDYNKCILHMIKHGSPCDYCEDLVECQEAGKDVQIGCDDWMLRHQDISTLRGDGEDGQETGGSDALQCVEGQ